MPKWILAWGSLFSLAGHLEGVITAQDWSRQNRLVAIGGRYLYQLPYWPPVIPARNQSSGGRLSQLELVTQWNKGNAGHR